MSDVSRLAPGVYVEEASISERIIHGAPTSTTAFIGRAERGPVNEPVVVRSVSDYDRLFGGLWAGSTMSHSIRLFFANGGSEAIVVRVHNDAKTATFEFRGSSDSLLLEAASTGAWANNLELEVDHETTIAGDDATFNLSVREIVNGEKIAEENFRNLSTDDQDDRYVTRVLEHDSAMLRVRDEVGAGRPDAAPPAKRSDGGDGYEIGFGQIAGSGLENRKEGLWALDNGELFNLLCIPPFSSDTDVDINTWTAAQKFCGEHRAFLIVDPPSTWVGPSNVVSGKDLAGAVPPRNRNAAIYFPRVRVANPLRDGKLETFAPSGAIAGIYARTDKARGVWKAPAGKETKLVGVDGVACELSDEENELLNGFGVNCIRAFDDLRCVLWGSRTTEGTNRDSSDWKYVSVRRLSLFIEQSVRRGTLWAMFEPVNARLRSEIRSHVGSFMAQLFRQGAFAGTMPDDAYFVECDDATTTESDPDRVIVNVDVGFAPLRRAEFIHMRIILFHY